MFTLLREDGTQERYPVTPTFPLMAHLLRCESFDVVQIGKANTPSDDQIMLVDDTSMLDGKPINPEATRLYHRLTRPDNPYSIHGDVIVAYDRDFR